MGLFDFWKKKPPAVLDQTASVPIVKPSDLPQEPMEYVSEHNPAYAEREAEILNCLKNKISPIAAGYIASIRYVPGRIGGQGHYILDTDNHFSRDNLKDLGLVLDKDFTRELHPRYPLHALRFTIEEPALEKILGVKHPKRHI